MWFIECSQVLLCCVCVVLPSIYTITAGVVIVSIQSCAGVLEVTAQLSDGQFYEYLSHMAVHGFYMWCSTHPY